MLSSSPTTPTIMRVTPTVCRSIPLTESSTAYLRIAPTGVMKREVPMVIRLPSPIRLRSMPTAPADTQYDLTPDQIDFRDTIRDMVRAKVAPRAAEIDAKA